MGPGAGGGAKGLDGGAGLTSPGSPSAEDPQDLLELAVEVARGAGAILMERFLARPRGVETKSTSTDLVSDADRMAERWIVEEIEAHRPDDGWLAEEGSTATSTSGITWVVDPLDATVNYLFRIPVWCVSIAVEDGLGALAGVVYDPNRDETFTATRGTGAVLNGDRIGVRDDPDLATALVGTGFAYDAGVRADQAAALTRLLPQVADIRRAGSAALDLCSVACGRYDGYYEARVQPWDKAAGVLIVREAGGVVSDLPGAHGDPPGVIAAGPRLHGALEALVLG